jgi:hypothetical protein
MKKKRHKWGAVEKNVFTEQQECEKCNLIRFKAVGRFFYSNEKVTEENPFPELVLNKGCPK